MPSRLLLALAALLLFASPLAAQRPDPVAIVKSIYGKRDPYKAAISLQANAHERPALSKSLAALWKKSDDATPEGGETPPGFDVASNSQGMDVKSAVVSYERRTSQRATVIAKLTAGQPFVRHSPEENVLRYDFIREDGHWKIDDVRGTIDKEEWSIRALLTEALKYH
jgi:hypothetical protein